MNIKYKNYVEKCTIKLKYVKKLWT